MFILALAALAADAQYCKFTHETRSCILCTASAATPARSDTTYTVSGACDQYVTGEVVLPNGKYEMAPGQIIKGGALSGTYSDYVIRGQLVVRHANNTIKDLSTTQHVHVTGTDCRGLAINNIVVTNDTIGVLVAGPHDGLGSINAAGASITNVQVNLNNSAAAAIVNAIDGPTVHCTTSTPLVVRDDPEPQPKEQVPSPCNLLSLSDVFQIYGSKMEMQILDEKPAKWLETLQWYNWYATQAALVALIAFATVKGPAI